VAAGSPNHRRAELNRSLGHSPCSSARADIEINFATVVIVFDVPIDFCPQGEDATNAAAPSSRPGGTMLRYAL